MMIWPFRTISGLIRPRTPGRCNDDVGLSHDVVERSRFSAHCGESPQRTGVEVRAEQAPHAHVLQEPHDADARGPQTDLADDATVDIDTGALRRVERRRQHDDRRSMLVVVQHRPAEPRAQPLLDFEAGRRGEILEQDGAEPRCDRGNVIDAARRIGLVEKNRHCVDVDEGRKKGRLAFHDRQPRERARYCRARAPPFRS
jgi:hypothetical protein